MWRKIRDSDYFLSFTHNKDYEICITDYVAIWTISYSEKAFIAQVKDSNKALQLKTDEDYISKGLYILSNIDKLKKINFTKEENGNVLSMSLKILHGFLLSLDCKLIKGSDEIYFEKITRPLLKTIYELHKSQSELRHELGRKDREIEEYKIESETQKVILRVSLKTEPFNDKEYMKKFKSYEEYFGSMDIPTSLLEKSFQTEPTNTTPEAATNPSIKRDPGTGTNIKPESTTLPNIEPGSTNIPNIKSESTNIPNVKQEPTLVPIINKKPKQEPVIIKEEPHTPLFEEPSSQLVTPAVSCKQEAIKREQESSQVRNNDRRKRLKKLNY